MTSITWISLKETQWVCVMTWICLLETLTIGNSSRHVPIINVDSPIRQSCTWYPLNSQQDILKTYTTKEMNGLEGFSGCGMRFMVRGLDFYETNVKFYIKLICGYWNSTCCRYPSSWKKISRPSYIVSTMATGAPDDTHITRTKLHCIEPILPRFWPQHQKGKSYIPQQNYAD